MTRSSRLMFRAWLGLGASALVAALVVVVMTRSDGGRRGLTVEELTRALIIEDEVGPEFRESRGTADPPIRLAVLDDR